MMNTYTKSRRWFIGCALATTVMCSSCEIATEDRFAPPAHNHDRYGTQPVDQHRTFAAFVVSFDGPDDDTRDGLADTLGIPQWVAYQINRHTDPLTSGKRPRKWSTDPDLAAARLAPTDDTLQQSLPKNASQLVCPRPLGDEIPCRTHRASSRASNAYATQRRAAARNLIAVSGWIWNVERVPGRISLAQCG